MVLSLIIHQKRLVAGLPQIIWDRLMGNVPTTSLMYWHHW